MARWSNAAAAVTVLLPGACAWGIAGAYPEGAPWGTAHPEAEEHCASCHYDYEPVAQSAALRLRDLPDRVQPGRSYPLELLFEAPDAVVSGFQILASDGRFESSAADIESRAEASRSTAVRRRDEGFRWPLIWIAPDESGVTVSLYLAASSANDDQSPLGDRIHYRLIEVAVGDEKGSP